MMFNDLRSPRTLRDVGLRPSDLYVESKGDTFVGWTLSVLGAIILAAFLFHKYGGQ